MSHIERSSDRSSLLDISVEELRHQQHQPSEVYSEQLTADETISAVNEIKREFSNLVKSNVGCVLLVKVSTMLVSVLFRDCQSSSEQLRLLNALLDMEIGSFCDPDIVYVKEVYSNTLADFSMFNSTTELFEIITRKLRPHYSCCGVLVSFQGASDTCWCCDAHRTCVRRYGLDVSQRTWLYQKHLGVDVARLQDKLTIMISVDRDATRRFVFRYCLMQEYETKVDLSNRFLLDCLGDTPFGVPISYVNPFHPVDGGAVLPSLDLVAWTTFRNAMTGTSTFSLGDISKHQRDCHMQLKYLLRTAHSMQHQERRASRQH